MSDLDLMRLDVDPRQERARLADRQQRADDLRDLWWIVVKSVREWERTGHAALVRWARAGLGFDDRILREDGQ